MAQGEERLVLDGGGGLVSPVARHQGSVEACVALERPRTPPA